MGGIWVVFIIFGALPAVVGFVYGTYKIKKDMRIEKEAVNAEGKILNIEQISWGRGVSYRLTASYILNEVGYKKDFSIDTQEVIGYKVGEEVIVVCQKSAPLNAQLLSHSLKRAGKMWIGFSAFWIGVMLLFCLFAIGSVGG